ncbi:hypothetical protein D9M69_657910 [compost metagenome]
MVAGEDADEWPVDRGLPLALPGREPFGDLLQAAQAAGRFSEVGVAGTHRVRGFHVGAGHRGNEFADIVEGQSGGGHGQIHHARAPHQRIGMAAGSTLLL